MNNPKYLVILILAVLLTATMPAMAQRNSGKQNPDKSTVNQLLAKMQQTLSLTDEQSAKIKSVLENELNQINTIMQYGDTESNREQIESIQKEAQTQMADILTIDQLSKLKTSASIAQKNQQKAPLQHNNTSSSQLKDNSNPVTGTLQSTQGVRKASGIY